MFKTWGPPYYKFKKTFKELPGSPEEKTEAEKGLFEKYFAKKSHAAH